MKKISINLRPSVLAVSAVLGVLASSHVMATSTIISTSIGSFGNAGSYDTLSISSSGTLSGTTYGINNTGTIDTVDNAGSISGTFYGIYNNGGMIRTLTNTGIISGAEDGIVNDGVIGVLSNTGTIVNTPNAIYNYGATIQTLTNSGIISGTGFGVMNYYATINNLANSGFISGGEYAIYNGSATIGNIVNTGTIIGTSYAVYNDVGGVMGTVTNSGVILGEIYSSTGLTIAGGTNGTIGTLSGYSNDANATIGGISITSGNLSLISGNLLLNDNVTLSSGTVSNIGAALYLANSITISGNYSQSASASLNSYVTGASTYGQLVVNGTATIASGSSVNLINQNYAFADGQRYVVVKATTGTYNAGSLNYSATGYSGTVTGSTAADGSYTDLVLTLAGGSTSDDTGGNTITSTGTSSTTVKTAQATTSNAISSLNGLQRYAGTSNAALLNLYDASLAISTTAEGNKAGEQLSPNQNSSAGYATSSATFDMLSVVGSHLGSVGAIKVAQSGADSGVATGEAAPNQAVWGQVFGGHATQGMTNDISGYRANYSGAVVGYDRVVTGDWRAGGALSYTYTSADGTDNVQGSNSSVSSVGLTAYASYVAPTWYSNLYATAAGQRYSTQRAVSFTGYNGVANGKFNGQQYVLKAEFGYPLALPHNLTLTPLANLSYSYLHQDGYTESGGNGSALQVNSAHSEAIKSGLGARIDTSLQTGWGEVVPYAQLLWNHQYNDSRMAVTAAYAADASNTSFTSLGSSPVKNAANLTLGAMLLRANNTSLTAYYDLTTASHYTNQALSLRFKQAF